MQEREKILALALDRWRDPLFIIDLKEERFIFTNRFFSDLLGFKETEEAELLVSDVWPGVSKISFNEEVLETEFVNAQRELVSVSLGITVLTEGCLLCLVLNESRSDKVLSSFRSQRMETLGMLAGGIAHDFNNVLAGILGHTTYLKTILPASGAHVESLTAIEDGARKASSMTQQILNFSKLNLEEKPAVLDLRKLVSETCKLLKGAMSPALEISAKLDEKEVCILGVEAKIAQVIANLVVNARDAIDGSGKIAVEVKSLEASSDIKGFFGGTELSAANYAALIVSDDGEGMPAEVLERVFEPYFSTKKERGTGLGLATVNSIVKSLGGAIGIDSSLGKGTSVSVLIPIVDNPKLQLSRVEKKEVENLVGGSESILIVDDEYSVRNVLSMSLQHLGYTVSTAASGEEAIDLFKKSEKNVDLVILDMLMPEMGGEEVFAVLKEINPDVGVLVISGYSSESVVQDILSAGGRGFIQKPFTIDVLARQVRSCLNS